VRPGVVGAKETSTSSCGEACVLMRPIEGVRGALSSGGEATRRTRGGVGPARRELEDSRRSAAALETAVARRRGDALVRGPGRKTPAELWRRKEKSVAALPVVAVRAAVVGAPR
jgi:hypothetical protein